MDKLKQKWNAMKPWQRYAIVGLVGLILGAVMGTYGTSPM